MDGKARLGITPDQAKKGEKKDLDTLVKKIAHVRTMIKEIEPLRVMVKELEAKLTPDKEFADFNEYIAQSNHRIQALKKIIESQKEKIEKLNAQSKKEKREE